MSCSLKASALAFSLMRMLPVIYYFWLGYVQWLAKVFTPLAFFLFCCLTTWNSNGFLGGLYHLIYTTYLPLWRCKIFCIVKQTRNKTKKTENLRMHNYSPPSLPKSILCRVTFCSNYSCKSFGVCIYKLDTSSHWEFCPFFKGKLLQLLQVGWVPLVYSNL